MLFCHPVKGLSPSLSARATGQGRAGSTEKKQVVGAEPWHCPSSVTKDILGAAQHIVLKQLPPRSQKVSALTSPDFLPKTECNDPKSSFPSLVPYGCLFSASLSSFILKKDCGNLGLDLTCNIRSPTCSSPHVPRAAPMVGKHISLKNIFILL